MAGISAEYFTQYELDELCSFISEGKSVRDWFKAKPNRSRGNFYLWLELHASPDQKEQYGHAMDYRQDVMFEDCLTIADDEAADVQSRRLRVDTRMKMLAKMNPKKYGDKLALDHNTSEQNLSDEQLKQRIAAKQSELGILPPTA